MSGLPINPPSDASSPRTNQPAWREQRHGETGDGRGPSERAHEVIVDHDEMPLIPGSSLMAI
ncbi:hypothetical protein PMG11_02192 [Penicillium brasilianum]|uniref:Uncharacterized protein n=1 Tax=Penicillium brasilianum TaxID=104259 RepID=A0A0F7THG8_PENBI|nr:hypothetical protein PMG11_02192 [Penicillium brasilianum]